MFNIRQHLRFSSVGVECSSATDRHFRTISSLQRIHSENKFSIAKKIYDKVMPQVNGDRSTHTPYFCAFVPFSGLGTLKVAKQLNIGKKSIWNTNNSRVTYLLFLTVVSTFLLALHLSQQFRNNIIHQEESWVLSVKFGRKDNRDVCIVVAPRALKWTVQVLPKCARNSLCMKGNRREKGREELEPEFECSHLQLCFGFW